MFAINGPSAIPTAASFAGAAAAHALAGPAAVARTPPDSQGIGPGTLAQFVIGVVAGLVDEVAGHVHPVFGGGTLVPVQNPDIQRGVLFLRRAFSAAPQASLRQSFDQLRLTRPLVSRFTAEVPPERAVTLAFSVRVSGNDFAAPGLESSPLALYVDGKYHSDVVGLAEHPGQYRVNIADLSVGRHSFELRFARDLAGTGAATPVVKDIGMTPLSERGALAARFAPLIETRWSAGFQNGGRPDQVHSDVPLVMTSVIEPAENGTRRIRYHLLSSNEDASGFPIKSLYRTFGRTTDYELVYEVWVDAQGNRLRDNFQGPLHLRMKFRGERLGDRPVLRVATRNGLFSGLPLHMTPRWSELPVWAYDRTPTDRQVMLTHPWTFAVAGKETIRERRSVPLAIQPHSQNQAPDARQHMYFSADDAARKWIERQRVVTVVLRNGTSLDVKVSSPERKPTVRGLPSRGTAIALPVGVVSNDIVGLQGPPGRVFVLDQHFRPRFLSSRPA